MDNVCALAFGMLRNVKGCPKDRTNSDHYPIQKERKIINLIPQSTSMTKSGSIILFQIIIQYKIYNTQLLRIPRNIRNAGQCCMA